MSVEKLSSIVGVISRILQPHGKIVLVVPPADELGIPTCTGSVRPDIVTKRGHTVWGSYICDIGVVRELPGQDRDASWAADGGRAEVLPVEGSTVDEMFVDEWNIVQ